MSEAAEQAVTQRFVALLDRIRTSGLSDEVAQVEGWIDQVKAPEIRAEMARLLAFWCLRRGETDKTVRYADIALGLRPDDSDSAYNAIFALFRAGWLPQAVARAEAALAEHGEHFQWHNILCTALAALGRLTEARRHGTRALLLKDALALAAVHELDGVPVPPFDPGQPRRNIVAFSLYGANPRYTEGAVLNARAVRFLYLGWFARFYIDDTVPQAVVNTLIAERAEVLKVGGLASDPAGPLWRFLVADDAGVDRYLLRDADSVVTLREAVAVQEWLVSGRHFHVMRDHPNHSELVLAGMWGGVRGALPPVGPAIQHYLATRQHMLGRTVDQEFLREVMWPTIRRSVLTHDSQFAFGERVDFPPQARLPPGIHVGCDGRKMLGLA